MRNPGRLCLPGGYCRGAKLATLKCLWHVDYFELKTIKTQKTQEKALTSPLAA